MTNFIQHIPSSYKSSPLGIIPEDWEVKRLGEVCTFLRNNTLSRNQLNETSGKVQNVHYGDILVKYPSILNARAESIPYVNQEDYKDTLNEFIEDGDVIMADTAEDETVGKACEIINVDSKRILAGLHTMLIRPQKGLFASSFLGYHINSDSYRRQLNALMQGIKVCSLGKQVIANTFLLAPPLPEQQHIVSVLSLWDAAISKQTAMIEKLTLRKRGLMQQLLTGKKRLNGFEGEWKEVRLGEICKITTGKLDANAMVNNGTYPFYTCAKEVYRINEYAFDTEALLVSGNGEHVGYVHYYKGKFNAYQRTYVLDEFRENIFYLYYALNQYLPKRILETKSNSNTPYIVMETLANMKLLLPDNNEQIAIASILVNADKEIKIQKQKLSSLQEQKRGLMQVLLTGKRRMK